MLGATLPSAGVTVPESPLKAGTFVRNQVIVRLSGASYRPLDAALKKGARVVDAIPAVNAVLLEVPDVTAAIRLLKAVPGIKHVEPNMTGQVAAAPPPSRANDPLVKGIGPTFADRQWYLQRINAPYAWTVWPQTYYSARTKPRNPVKVAVLDTAIDTQHRDWRNAGGSSTSSSAGGQIDVSDAKSFIAANDAPGASLWHGTFIAGLIGAAADNSTDMAGIAYPAQIMPVAVAKGSGTLEAFTLAKGITWAADRGARVINMSLTVHGSSSQVDTLRTAVNRAVRAGAVLIAALGNTDSDDAEYPAGFAAENPGVLAVGATDIFDRRDRLCSKNGRHISVVAPDHLIWSIDPQNRADSNDKLIRREQCRTSISAGIVSGVAALVAGTHPKASPAEIARRIIVGADDIAPAGRDDETGAGRVNAERAMWNRGGPGTSWLSIPTPGPNGKVTLVAATQSTAGVAAAEFLIDGRQRGKGVVGRAADGSFGGRGERVALTIDTSGWNEGPHELHVRAKDANGQWGPAASSVLIVDRSKPTVPAPVTFPNNLRPALDPDHPAAAIHFSVYDTWSRTLRVKVDIIDATLTSQASFLFAALPSNVTYPIPWLAIEKAHGGPLLPGSYRIIVSARDLAGLEAYGDGQLVLLVTKRVVPSPSSIGIPGGPGVPTGVPTSLPSPTGSPTVTPPPIPTGSPTTSPS